MAETKTTCDLDEEIESITSIFEEIEVKSNPNGQTLLIYGCAPNTITVTITGM